MEYTEDADRRELLLHSAYDSDTVRAMERPLLDKGVPLMRMAAQAAAHMAAGMLDDEDLALEDTSIVLLAGAGDNGGDGLFAAAALAQEGANVTAIAVGMLNTVVLFMKMVSEETEVKGWTYFCDKDSEVTHLRELPKSVRVYEINGPMFFGMTDRISDISVKDFTKYLIIRMRGVPSLDATGMNALENLYEYCAENGVQLIFSHANEQPMRTMRRAGFVDLVGEERFRPNIDDAIAYARTQLEQEEKAA